MKKEAWEQVERVMRYADKISKECQNIRMNNGYEIDYIKERVGGVSNYRKYDQETREVLNKLAMRRSGVKVLSGAAGTGKTSILSGLNEIYYDYKIVGIAPTNKAVNGLRENGFSKVDTVSGFLWKLEKGKSDVEKGSIVMVDEAELLVTIIMIVYLVWHIRTNCH